MSVIAPAKSREIIEGLVKKFEQNKAAIKSLTEEDTKVEYITPLFEALGWDVYNSEGNADSFKEVKFETGVDVRGNTKAADYSFYLGKLLFYVEAKRPSIDIKENINSSFQIRSYGWSSVCPLGVLTNFEELSIYKCSEKPKPTDKSHVDREFCYTYDTYLEHWDEIYALLSKEAVRKGSLETFKRKNKGKGAETVDKEFLKSLSAWRKTLALHIAKHNDITEKDLNYGVYKIIDRLIFLRICEDRGIEGDKTLLRICEHDNVYESLKKLFYNADDKYNSGLFHFQEEKGREAYHDIITPTLTIENKTLKAIIGDMYYPNSPYAFGVMPADILGKIYEKFLGNTITLSDSGKTAKVEEKIEVRKAGGVYYTPYDIVRFIVTHTLDPLFKNKTPKSVENIRIVDPACGSASFLLEVYQYLLDWYRNYYIQNNVGKHKKGKNPVLFETVNGDQLTLSERKRILTTHIYGVDIDIQAVEVAKLSLLLKVLEYEGQEIRQKVLFEKRILPDLHENIKCGNSLVGSSVFGLQLEQSTIARINPFDWNSEFRAIMSAGGFDVVVGNPPYIQLQKFKGSVDDEALQQAMKKAGYAVHHSMGDIYSLFYEKGIQLLKPKGILGYITSNKWMRAGYGELLRGYLSQQNPLYLLDLGGGVFEDATVDTNILIVKKEPNKHKLKAKVITDIAQLHSTKQFLTIVVSSDTWAILSPIEQSIKAKIEEYGTPLKDWDIQIYRGILTGYNEAFIIDTPTKERLCKEDPKSIEVIKPILRGKDITRYYADWQGLWILFIPWHFPLHNDPNISGNSKKAEKDFKEQYPAIFNHLLRYKEKLSQRNKSETGIRYEWYTLQRCAASYYNEFEKEKIVYSEIVQRPQFHFDTEKYYPEATTFLMTGKHIKYLLCFLNNSFIAWCFKNYYTGGGLGEHGFRCKKKFLINLPIPKISTQGMAHFEILSDRMIEAHTLYNTTSNPQEKEQSKRKIDALDNQINALVYALYKLSPEEIKYIEQV